MTRQFKYAEEIDSMASYGSMKLGGEERNAERLGAYVAWLINNHLFDQVIERSAAKAITRVRMQEMTGAGFLSSALHGELKPDQLTDMGRAFSEHYFVVGTYDQDYDRLVYRGEDEWVRYAEISPAITKAFQHFKQPRSVAKKVMGKLLQFPGRKK